MRLGLLPWLLTPSCCLPKASWVLTAAHGSAVAPPCAQCLLSRDMLCQPLQLRVRMMTLTSQDPKNNFGPFTSCRAVAPCKPGSYCDSCLRSLISFSKEQFIYDCGLSPKTCDIR